MDEFTLPDDLSREKTGRLKRWQMMFQKGTEEWFHLEQEIRYRKWCMLYGVVAANEMRQTISRLSMDVYTNLTEAVQFTLYDIE